MEIEKKVINFLKKYNYFNVVIDKNSDLFLDIGLDSLSFLEFLTELEKKFDTTFNVCELADCLKVENLIKLVKDKVKGS